MMKQPVGRPVADAISDLLIESKIYMHTYRVGGRRKQVLLNLAMEMTREALRLRKLQKFSKSRMTISRIGFVNLGEQR